MANGYSIAYYQRMARRVYGAARVGNVQDAVILNVAALANRNTVDVTAYNRKRPDRTVTADFNFTNDQRGVIDVNAIADLGCGVFECTKSHIILVAGGSLSSRLVPK
ncbi:hypothetical protein MNBD_GAMMA24-127 [hydrothermal vent metagenome]|uniref:Uncharacterized protein n=1 Tax=hydrothermal vent metagenome TaxID=652676 RepID=A0A3B1BQ54_9ZZZZ